MKRIPIRMAILVLLPVFAAGTARAQGPSTFEFDAAGSTLEIDVARGGLFKMFGHDHRIAAREFSGRVVLDADRPENSSVTLRVAAGSLAVIDPELSDRDRAEIQATMQSAKVLDGERFPEILFSSTGVTRTQKSEDSWSLTLTGRLRLHGGEREINFPLTLRLDGTKLAAEGEVFLLQTDYGITPVKAAGGTVKVQDRLRIHFVIHALSTTP